MSRRTLDEVSEDLRSIEERLSMLESYMQEFLEWRRRRDEILRRAKRQRGRNVVALFPRRAVRS
jgi:hypothetical protein